MSLFSRLSSLDDAFPTRWGLSSKPCRITVQVYWVASRVPGSLHSKAKKFAQSIIKISFPGKQSFLRRERNQVQSCTNLHLKSIYLNKFNLVLESSDHIQNFSQRSFFINLLQLSASILSCPSLSFLSRNNQLQDTPLFSPHTFPFPIPSSIKNILSISLVY